jgi:hypothetical protein
VEGLLRSGLVKHVRTGEHTFPVCKQNDIRRWQNLAVLQPEG